MYHQKYLPLLYSTCETEKKEKEKKNTSIPCWVRKNGEQNSKERARATERIGGKIWEWKGAKIGAAEKEDNLGKRVRFSC